VPVTAPQPALAGIRVLDLSRVLAGPSCAQLMADLGADVIKIEDRQGDENRRWMPVVDGRGANYFSANRGKRGMTLNLKSPRGQEILEALVRQADVLIENFPPSTAERLGLSPCAADRRESAADPLLGHRLWQQGSAPRPPGLRQHASGLQRHDGDDRRA
jgi:crotonobetainyl-CoA:carnitine CoA-transferase CaiB-like acyl-CoA transferase